MTTPAIAHYLFLLDDVFAGPDWRSLLSNLNTVAPAAWVWGPLDGVRSIRDYRRAMPVLPLDLLMMLVNSGLQGAATAYRALFAAADLRLRAMVSLEDVGLFTAFAGLLA